MPRYSKEQIRPGMRLTSDGGAATFTESAPAPTIKKGAFMTVDAPITKRQPLPPDLAEFEEAAATADRFFSRQQLAIQEMTRRFQAVRKQLDKVKRK